ncbi:sulfite exporter TauE/SafE family protein [Arthrobacter mobilis]|uniref:Probable membrane transporter protein n=1 Tax=Arthrobacter mobilis TaxID=2724944 RepID=A0A7X6HEH6_9MICC|nr:sulfite exporter TauE/SafE family protein [Arthrobacter mobilis]NKX54764.1 sulfite exporter TauE/SafE family protein [Arthrobacter mobilis]
MSGAELVIIATVIVVASCLQGAIGFGLGLMAAPVIALIDPTLLPGSLVLLAAGATTLGVIRDRTTINFAGAGWALLGRVPGTALGALLVVILPARGLALTLAGAVLFGVMLSICGWRPKPRPLTVAAAGAASGILGTATSIGGPPMALVWHGSSKSQMRGTMSAFFLVGAIMSLTALAWVGALDHRTLIFAALLAPAMILGFALSRILNRRLNRRRIRHVALSASTLGAILVLLQAL